MTSESALPPQLDSYYLKCSFDSEATMVCCSKDCTTPGLICDNPECPCIESHMNCKIKRTEPIWKRIQKKRDDNAFIYEKEINSQREIIDEWYEEMIEKLSELRYMANPVSYTHLTLPTICSV